MDRVPYDGATIIAHRDEMVLSARYANPLRDMLSGGNWGLPSTTGQWGLPAAVTGGYSLPAANNNTPTAANQGDTHNHYEAHFHGPANKSEVHAWLKDHATGVAAAADHGVRLGYKSRSKPA